MTTDYATQAGTDAIASALDLNTGVAKDKKAAGTGRSFVRSEEPPREPEEPSQAKVIPLAHDKPASFNHVGDNMLFVGYKMIDHIRHFRAAYTRRPIENRGHVTEVFIAAVHTTNRVNGDSETISRTFATPMEAETFIQMHYASVELPDLMFDVLGTTVQHNEDALKKMETEFINSEFAD